MSKFTSVEDPEEGRLVDLYMETGLETARVFLNRISAGDLADCIRAAGQVYWPKDKIAELIVHLEDLIDSDEPDVLPRRRTKSELDPPVQGRHLSVVRSKS